MFTALQDMPTIMHDMLTIMQNMPNVLQDMLTVMQDMPTIMQDMLTVMHNMPTVMQVCILCCFTLQAMKPIDAENTNKVLYIIHVQSFPDSSKNRQYRNISAFTSF